MQEEVTRGAVTLIVDGAKLSEQVFEKAVKKFLEEIQKSQKPKIYRGRQSLKQLASQNAGLANIEISDKNIKAFSRVAKKYHVDFGGLVELGNIDQLIVLMKDAFQEALVCTNDPECLNNVPAGNNSNGAACHSCCMISETACENGNRMLDRGLIVPIDGRENQSYFKTLVEELCQLEV